MSQAHQPPSSVSVIVPAYNSEDNVAKTVESLLNQTLSAERLEIILINDGSTDNTLQICHSFKESATNIVVIDKRNGGVSSARNAGIDVARGKYLAFVDSDDTLLPETLEAVVGFFDKHYDEVDAVSYPMRLYNERREWSHDREDVLTHTGVYDLTKLQNAFALITNVNVVVKNNEELPRFREDLVIHEDELFFTTILLAKQKVGFCKQGAYRYQQLPGSAVGTKMHPFYQFEQNVAFWEELFAAYPDEAPLYLQASFLNEVRWKTKRDILLPYHYEKPRFDNALKRISRLMDRVDSDLIFTSPHADEYFRHYLFTLKADSNARCDVSKCGIIFSDSERLLLCRNHVELEFVWTQLSCGSLRMKGILKSVAFDHTSKPELHMTINNEDFRRIPLYLSSSSIYQANVKTCTFWGFDIQIPLMSTSSVTFKLQINDIEVPLWLCFSTRAQLNTENGISSFVRSNALVSVNPKQQGLTIKHTTSPLARQASWIRNTLSVLRSNKKSLAIRAALKVRPKRRHPVWLYYDRPGIHGDNAYLQFLHDFDKQDGIDRFYVTRDDETAIDTMFESRRRAAVLDFSSVEHRFLHLQADRIIASYMELPTWCPFSRKTLDGLSDLLHYDMVYLQHGVLHARMPWKCSADHLMMEYQVVSTGFEANNLQQNYGFLPEQIITSGMPRYDCIDANAPSERRILFAPSWRKSLVASLPNTQFGPKPAALMGSSLWRETTSFLTSETLWGLLEEHDYHLDIKLHPNFSCYREDFKSFENERIHVVEDVRESDYQLFVTDYSSWVFDFVYLKRAVAYFLPDEDEFNSGLHGYHELDLPLEEGFGPLTHTGAELLDVIRDIICAGGQPSELYRQRMDGFFFYYDNNQRERLYQALLESFTRKQLP